MIMQLIRTRAVLLTCIVIGILVYWSLTTIHLHDVTKMIIGWNTGTILYMTTAFIIMSNTTNAGMRQRAIAQDEGQFVILTLVVIAALMSVGAIVGELSVVKNLHGVDRYAHVGLAILTIVTTWLFTQLMFAIHYAHDYYSSIADGIPPGIQFPEACEPDYGDFLYFACIIGTSAQTADVSFTSKIMRRTGLVHCVLAFFFNIALLGLTINIVSGLF